MAEEESDQYRHVQYLYNLGDTVKTKPILVL